MNSIDATVFVPDPRKLTRCRGCRERIFFATTRDGRNIPIDEKPASDGNLAIAPVPHGQTPHAEVVRPAQADGMRVAGVPTWRAHFATCPSADQFRYRARTRTS